MPVYEYRCDGCRQVTAQTHHIGDAPASVTCEFCGSTETRRIISRTSVHRSPASKVARLDPKYDRMVDQAMKNTQNAEPDHLLKRTRPFTDKS